MFKAFRQMSLSSQIFAGLFAGLIFGLILVFLASINSSIAHFIDTYIVVGFTVIKQLFMNALKMVVVPLVFVSLICGTCSLTDPKKLGSLAGASISLYIFTTTVAITLALMLASFFEVGVGKEVSQAVFQSNNAPSLVEILSALVPNNPVQAMASGNMLQVIVFAILFGIAISRAGEQGKAIANFFEAMNHVILKLVTIIMHIAPYGVFGIMSLVIYNTGLDAIINLASYFAIVILALLVHFSVTYTSLLVFFYWPQPS
ncbi:MAG: cation:dicarboxylase symporter family transporter [Enterobacterales bacterium]|nr:cation:dicarboxylase symporter family transporter [Enterobacterales bacterium]